MKKILLTCAILAFSLTSKPTLAGPTTQQLYTAYKYAYALYAARNYTQAKDIFKKIIILSPALADLNANSLYYYSQCSFRAQDYDGCMKALNILAKRWPNSAAIKNGYVTRFSSFLIDQVARLQIHWDYFRYPESTDEKGGIVWKESVPPGFKARRINFRLGFGLLRVLNRIEPNAPETTEAKQKLANMLNQPITILWMDEKAPTSKYGHPADFFSFFSLGEKKTFSKVICDRIFYNWESDKFYQFLDMYDDVRNLKPRFIAKTKQLDNVSTDSAGTPPPVVNSTATLDDYTSVLTLTRLFRVAGYDPYNDSFINVIESDSPDTL